MNAVFLVEFIPRVSTDGGKRSECPKCIIQLFEILLGGLIFLILILLFALSSVEKPQRALQFLRHSHIHLDFLIQN
jgi:uncharacterized integral membrane protein